MKLKTKLMLYFIVIMSVGVISSSYIIYYNVYEITKKNAEETIEVTVKSVQNSKLQIIDNIETSLGILSELVRIKDVIATDNLTSLQQKSINYFLQNNLRFLIGVNHLILLNEDGMAVASTQPTTVGINYGDRAYFAEAMGNGISIDGPYFSEVEGKHIFTVSVVVLADNGKKGVLMSSIEADKLGYTPSADLKTAKNQLIFTANNSGDIINSLDKVLPHKFKFLDSSELNKGSGKINIVIDNVIMLAYYEHIFKDLYAFTAIPAHQIEDDATSVRNQSLFVGGLIILNVALIFSFLTRDILLSLQKAIVFTKTVSSGDLSAKLDIDRTDEIGEFALSLTQMVENLAKNEELLSVRKSLELETALMKAIIKNIPDILFIQDCKGKFKNCNDAYYRFLNKTPKDVIGNTNSGIFDWDPETAEEFNKRDDYVISNKEILTNEEWVRSGDFSEHLFETIRAPFSSDDGETLGLVGICRDITLRYNQEKIIEKTKMDALEASRAKSEFLARMSHEIRTPLNGIIGMNYLALQSAKDEETKNFLTKIESSASNLLAIVNDILDFSKIEAGKMEIESVPFCIEDVTNNVQDAVIHNVKDKDVKYFCNIDPNIPKMVIGDPLRLSQVLLNFLSNAVKFTEKGEITLDIVIESSDDSYIALSFTVADTGIGMKDEHKNKLFSAFTQADGSTSRKYGGTGLGLSISKLLVDLMGGRITVESEYMKGSKFSCYVKFAKASSVYQISSEVKNDDISDDSIKKLEGKRVLLVEDNLINQEIAKLLLKKFYVDVSLASDGLEAIDVVEKSGDTPFDLILMDMQMPNLDGYEATKRLRKNGLKTPIVAMTANAMSSDKEKAFSVGMDDYLAKPYKIDALKAILIRWLL